MQGATDVAPISGAMFQLEMVAPEKNRRSSITSTSACSTSSRVRRTTSGPRLLAGDISIADFMLYATRARKALIDAAGGHSNLHRWAATIAARPGVEKG